VVTAKENTTEHFDNILVRINEAGRILNLPDWQIKVLRAFKSKWDGDLLLTKDDGTLEIYNACRVWHKSPHTDKPHKGGNRYHPLVSIDMMKAHAIEMSIKLWLMGIPMGGAKGGIAVDPATLSRAELKRLTELYVEALIERNLIGPLLDVPAPDVGTNSEIMNWVRQCYALEKRELGYEPFAGVVTGKPVGYGFDGIEGRTEATGYGVIEVLEHLVKRYFGKVGRPRIAVMGYGNVGFFTVEKANVRHYPIIGVSDRGGGVYNSKGLNITELNEHFREAKTVAGFRGGDAITSEELLVLQDIDWLIPAALEHVLTVKNASRVGAKIVGEGGNSTTTPGADEIFKERGIIVAPDVCTNAKGVTISFFEWARNLNICDERVPTGEKRAVLAAATKIILRATDEMCANAEKYQTTLRNAAFVTAINRVAPLLTPKYAA